MGEIPTSAGSVVNVFPTFPPTLHFGFFGFFMHETEEYARIGRNFLKLFFLSELLPVYIYVLFRNKFRYFWVFGKVLDGFF